jgi:hypothetical protein
MGMKNITLHLIEKMKVFMLENGQPRRGIVEKMLTEKNGNGFTALHLIAKENKIKIYDLLVKKSKLWGIEIEMLEDRQGKIAEQHLKDEQRYKRRKAEERRLALEKERLARDRQIDLNSTKEEQAVKKMKELDDLRREKTREASEKAREAREEKLEVLVPALVLLVIGLITMGLYLLLSRYGRGIYTMPLSAPMEAPRDPNYIYDPNQFSAPKTDL